MSISSGAVSELVISSEPTASSGGVVTSGAISSLPISGSTVSSGVDTITEAVNASDAFGLDLPTIALFDQQHLPVISPFHRLEQRIDPPIAPRIMIVGTAQNQATNVSTIPVTLTAKGNNNLIVVYFSTNPNTTIITSIVSTGLSFSKIVSSTEVDNNEVWYAWATTPLTAQTITVNLNANTNNISGGCVIAQAYSGINRSWPFDNGVSIQTYNPAGSGTPSFTIAPSNQNDMMVFVTTSFGSPVTASPPGFTNQIQTSANTQLAVATLLQSPVVNQTVTWGGAVGHTVAFFFAITADASLQPSIPGNLDDRSMLAKSSIYPFHRLEQVENGDGWPFAGVATSAPANRGMRKGLRIR